MNWIPPSRIGRGRLAGLSTTWKADWPVVIAAALILSACAAPAAKKHQTATPSPAKSKSIAHSPMTALRSAQAVSGKTTRRLGVAVLTAKDYLAGRKQRENILISRLGPEALSRNNVGYYMEVEEADLRRRLSSGAHARIARQNGGVIIGPIERAFASDSAQIGEQLGAILDTVAPVFREFSKTLVIIHAYTDASGSRAYNRKLSLRRGLSVARYLLKAGVAATRIIAVGHGELARDGTHGTARDRAEDRCVTIELAPLVHQ